MNVGVSDYLQEIQARLDWSDELMCERMGITLKEWNKLKLGRDPSLMAMTRFSESLDVDVEMLYKKNVDISLLVKREQTALKDIFPDRYIPGALSRVRTSLSLLQYLEHRLGWRQRVRILRRFQMNEKALADPDRLINIRFFSDICDSMRELGYSSHFIYEMGRFSVVSNRRSVVGKLFEGCVTPQDVFEKIVPVLSTYFERNHHYRILQLSPKHCVIESKINPELQEALGLSQVGGLANCDARRGVASSFAMYAGDVKTRVVETQCVHRGDSSCVFRVEWDQFTPQV